MLKVVHLILAHNRPQQLHRLINELLIGEDVVFVHLDKKANLSDFSFLQNTRNVFLISKNYKVNWGGFNLVKAIISSIQQIQSSKLDYDFLNILSGQDYPLKPITQFHAFLEDNTQTSFLEVHLPGHPWLEGLRPRLNDYHMTDFTFRGSTLLEGLMTKVLPRRKLPADLCLVGHSCWMTITREAVQYLNEYLTKNSKILKRFEFTWGADEIFIQSILYSSPLKSKIKTNNNLRYIDWSEQQPSPKTLTMVDRFALTSTSSFFGRKFDENVDSSILDYIDCELLRRNNES